MTLLPTLADRCDNVHRLIEAAHLRFLHDCHLSAAEDLRRAAAEIEIIGEESRARAYQAAQAAEAEALNRGAA